MCRWNNGMIDNIYWQTRVISKSTLSSLLAPQVVINFDAAKIDTLGQNGGNIIFFAWDVCLGIFSKP